MKEQRVERVAELIKREVSIILLSRVRDPRLKRFTITRVKVSQDLRQAKVFIYFPEGDKEEKYQALQKATGFIKSELALRLRIKFMPEIVFVIDDTMEKAFQVVELLIRWKGKKMEAKKEIIEAFQLHNHFIIISHQNIDGDGLGSMLATFFFLKEEGKNRLWFKMRQYLTFTSFAWKGRAADSGGVLFSEFFF